MSNDPSKKKPILKFFLIGCGTITALVSDIIVWIAVSLFLGRTPGYAVRSSSFLGGLGVRSWRTASEEKGQQGKRGVMRLA